MTLQQFLVALSRKGETAHEIAALASVMRSFAIDVSASRGSVIWIIVGRAATVSNSFNISTTSAFVLAGAGA